MAGEKRISDQERLCCFFSWARFGLDLRCLTDGFNTITVPGMFSYPTPTQHKVVHRKHLVMREAIFSFGALGQYGILRFNVLWYQVFIS